MIELDVREGDKKDLPLESKTAPVANLSGSIFSDVEVKMNNTILSSRTGSINYSVISRR